MIDAIFFAESSTLYPQCRYTAIVSIEYRPEINIYCNIKQ